MGRGDGTMICDIFGESISPGSVFDPFLRDENHWNQCGSLREQCQILDWYPDVKSSSKCPIT